MKQAVMPKGEVEVIVGCMFSGKSEELMRRIRRAHIAKKKVFCCKSDKDKRSAAAIWSRDTGQCDGMVVKEAREITHHVAALSPDIVVIDEIQFFDMGLMDVVEELLNQFRVRVIAAGLDTDFLGKPWPVTAMLLAMADYVTKLSAICVVCGDRATMTQRMLAGKPAPRDSPVILVDNLENYEARCRTCHVVGEQFSPVGDGTLVKNA